MNDLVSIIVPVFNSEKFLSYCLDSILNQTYTNIEVLLVDDGSNDNSLEICHNYSKRDNRVVVISKLNEGVSIARNTAIRQCRGKYVAFVDSDDIICSNMIELLVNDITKNDCDLAACGIKKINEYEEFITDNFYDNNVIRYDRNTFFDLILNQNVGGFLCNKLYKLSIIKSNNLEMNENVFVCEDLLFNVEYLLKSNNFCYNPNFLYGYVQHSNGSFFKKNNIRWFTIFNSYLMIIEKIYNQNFSDNILEKLHYQLCYISCEAIAKNNINSIKYKNIGDIKKYIKNNFNKILFFKSISLKDKIKLVIYKIFPTVVFKYKLSRIQRSSI